MLPYTIALLSLFCMANSVKFPNNQFPKRSTIVHLFEWKWRDIADECEKFLGPKRFGGVQISPPSENVIIHLKDGTRPWYERYQVMSYKLITRSGDEDDFLDMTQRCNKAGVRIYADVVFNHMTGNNDANIGTGGSTADFGKFDYPAVPYTKENFHSPLCDIHNFDNATEVRDCQLEGLKDLNQTQEYVRGKITAYLNKLIKLGVAGFRVDAAKHMWPSDLKVIYDKLDDLNTEFGFSAGSRAYFYQEVIEGTEAVQPQEYTSLGAVTEFRVGRELSNSFRGKNALKWLVNWGEPWGLLPSKDALTFVDNHDSQRNNDGSLTYKEPKAYKAATAFVLAHPYGQPKIMSSFAFDSRDQGPPSDGDGNIISPTFNKDKTCNNGWVCEHRWRQMYQMVGFRNAACCTKVRNWWDNGSNQIAFSRGNQAFIAFNLDNTPLNKTLQTGLPPGVYCDVITGEKKYGRCTGKTITVKDNGEADIYISHDEEDMHLAIHVGKESLLHKNH